MNTHLVTRTIAALTVSAAAVTGAAGFAGATQTQAPAPAAHSQVSQDQWALDLVSTFTARYTKALRADAQEQALHLRESYFMTHGELILREIEARVGGDPIYKNFGLPKSEKFEITESNPSFINIKYTARTTDNKLHSWNFQVDQEAALIKQVQLA